MDTQPPASDTVSTDVSPKTPLFSSAPFLQSVVLCFLALVCAVLQVSAIFQGVMILDPFLLLGIGCLLGFFIYPRRLFIPAALMLPLGSVNVLASMGILAGNLAPAYYFIGLGVGLVAIAQVTQLQLGWVQPGAISPGLFLVFFGGILLAAANSSGWGQFLYSLWLPAAVLGALGLTYLGMTVFKRAKA